MMGTVAGRGALVLCLVGVMAAPAAAQSAGEQVRAKIVDVLNGPSCLGFLPSVKALTTTTYIRACLTALRDELNALVIVEGPPPPPPPSGTMAVVTCAYPLGVLSPPSCSAAIP